MMAFASCSQPSEQESDPLVQLEEAVKAQFNAVEGDFALAFQEVGNPEKGLQINAKETFHAASTMKTPVMIELFKQSEEGLISLDDSVLIKNEFYSIVDSSTYSMDVSRDSEGDLYDNLGKPWPIRDLMYRMVTKSSNLATNILIEMADAKKVTQTMREMGAPDIQVLRGVEDMKAFEQGLSNTTTAYDLMMIYEGLAAGEVLKNTQQKAIDMLKAQQYNDIIPGKLPEGVEVAHKTGWITGVRHDSGLVYHLNGKEYAVVLLSKNVTDMDAAVNMMAEVSKMVYDYIGQTP